MLKNILALTLGALIFSEWTYASIQSNTVSYNSNGAMMEGFIAYDDSQVGKRPAVLIVPDWMGMSDFAKDKALSLAKKGYVAFVADVYGKGIRPENHTQAGELATKYKSNRPLLRDHMKAAFDSLVALKQSDPNKVAVMGYCFGGTAALELARSGAPLVGTATFHGGLSNPTPLDAQNIKGQVLVMHGSEDPFVSKEEVQSFKEEMNNAKINYKWVEYPGAVHAFTNPDAGADKTKGMAYNHKADLESWAELERFLKSAFQ